MSSRRASRVTKKTCVQLLDGIVILDSARAQFVKEIRVAIVCGGRDYVFVEEDYHWLDELYEKYKFNIVRHGGATGADECADNWAHMRFIKRDPMPVTPQEWDMYRARSGKSYAGMRRNQQMADKEPKPFLCINFPGGSGTASMVKIAQKAGMIIETQSNERFITWSSRVSRTFF